MLQRTCDYIDRKIEEGYCNRYAAFLNGFIKRLGCLLVYLVYLISTFIAFTAFAIILPYEQIYKSSYLCGILFVFGVYIFVMIEYHYYKARTLPPIPQPGKEGDRFCERCNYWKNDRTHHCGVCNKCIMGMDHHCIWINTCVGSHNHRHFFLFICSLTIATLTILVAGFNTAYDHVFEYFNEHNFCAVNLAFAPLQGYICEYGQLARNLVIFCYFLSGLLFLLVGGLSLWNVYLISQGFTYIDYLRHTDFKHVPGYKNHMNKGFKENWTNFLGLRRNRHFWSHVLLPSSHPPIVYDSLGRLETYDKAYDIV